MSVASTIVWFRQDLRLEDHPALLAAARRGGPVVPVYIWSPEEEGAWAPGAASRWWLHHSLQSLDVSLRARGSRLVVCRGPSADALRSVAVQTGADAVYWSRRYEPDPVRRDREVRSALAAQGMGAAEFPGALLLEPEGISNREGQPFQVFTPFWKACSDRLDYDEPAGAPGSLPAPPSWPDSLRVRDLALCTEGAQAPGFAAWSPGETGARTALQRFAGAALREYAELRDRPDCDGVSRLSPHLHYGEVSPRQVACAVRARSAAGRSAEPGRGAAEFLRQLGWREFAHHLLRHFPHTAGEPLRAHYARFPWREDDAGLRAWQEGRTGYPLVDAGMRQLRATGWMHNRVRMVAASFLVKHLLVPWQEGARWFWETLVDADLANNTMGWQWTAGCGADAAPYFRVFNPATQGERHDPAGGYVRRWVPELSGLAAPWVHRPWDAPDAVLRQAGVEMGAPYPGPLVDHAFARQRALDAYRDLQRSPARPG